MLVRIVFSISNYYMMIPLTVRYNLKTKSIYNHYIKDLMSLLIILIFIEKQYISILNDDA